MFMVNGKKNKTVYKLVGALLCMPMTSRFAINRGDFDPNSYKTQIQNCQFESESGKRLNLISLRTFKLKNSTHRLVVNADNLQTAVVPSECLQNCSDLNLSKEIASKHNSYYEALTLSQSSPYPVSTDGILRSQKNKKQIFLTVDLCPSSKTLEHKLFDSLAQSNKPTPVGVAISGLWINKHRDEFIDLLKREDENRIKITWINHSLTHPYDRNIELSKNFLLKPGVNFNSEVLDNEALMLSQGLVPSVYFRFPGLVSNEEKIKQLAAWGLIAIGSDAWLAKGEKVKNGSIILTHGNGNEPRGVDLWLQLLDQNPGILNWLKDLSQAFL